jgi:hypothetical protein
MAKLNAPEELNEFPEDNEYWVHEQSACGSKLESVNSGVYDLSDFPEWTVEDLRRFKAQKAHSNRLQAKEAEERRRQDDEDNQRRINQGAAVLKIATSQRMDPEVEARAWAKGYFQDKADEISHAGSKRYAEKEHTQETGWSYEDWLHRGRGSLAEYAYKMRLDVIELAAILIQRGDPFPNQQLRDFIADFLRKHNKQSKKRGPKQKTLERRNEVIATAVRYIVERWRLEIVRNPLTTRASAASIVAASVGMSEKAVNKICDSKDWRGWLRYVPIMEGDSACRRMEKESSACRKN